ncbi:MAG: PEP-CTERM sorting domain-containing protein [Acidobacteriota bacterium]
MMKRSLIIGLAMILLLWGLGSAFATPLVTLTNKNSTFAVDLGSQEGAYQWLMDGTSQLFQEWFWYRVGDTPLQSIETLTLTDYGHTKSLLEATYSGAGFEIDIVYSLLGGNWGSGTSDVSEQISISNTGSSALDFHFYMYTDFDLGGTSTLDAVQLPGTSPHEAIQVNSSKGIIGDTVVTQTPQRWEADYYPNTVNRLNSGAPITLNDTNAAGPGDVTWAFEWDQVLAASGNGSSMIIGADKNIRTVPVPEPTSLILVGGGLMALAGFGRKLRARK